MGRWDDEWHYEPKGRKKRDWIRIARYTIYGGFAIVAIVVLLVFIPRAGLTVEINETGETLSTIGIKINNNNPQEIHNVTITFDNNTSRMQIFNSMAPFSSIFVTPEKEDLDFRMILVTADDGRLQTIKFR